MWESAVNREALKDIAELVRQWRDDKIDAEEAVYEIESIVDEVGVE
jgi:hypothetical protein